MTAVYDVCCKECGRVLETFEMQKDAKAKARRYTVQRLTCEKCGCRDWLVSERASEE